MHPETSPAHHRDVSYVTLAAPMLLDRLHRKIRRSKKLTKLFLDDGAWLQLISQSEALQQSGRRVSTLTTASALPQVTSLAFIGSAPMRLDLPSDPTHFPEVRLLRFDRANAYGRSSLIQLQTGRVIHHDLITPSAHMISEEDHRQLRIDAAHLTCQFVGAPLLTTVLHKAALFTDSVATNYAHWLTEVLPRIALYVRSALSADVPLIIDDGLHPNLYESLAIVVGSKRRVYKLPQDRRVHVQQLDVVTPTGYVPYAARPPKRAGHSHGIFSAEALWAVRDACKHLMPPVNQTARKRIYVRRNSGLRKLVNDQQISETLTKAGFTVIAPEELSFSEQVRLFSQAELVIGATGAAMANLMFCPPGSRVHVLMAQHEDMPYCYWQRLADCIGINLSYGMGEVCAAHEKGFHADFTVDINHIDRVLSNAEGHCAETLCSAP
ncbi:MAG: glycosyltransferase family 61 protein [Aquabacterium sp.]|uniref:glycosyltransferase family 61 protein n=1 Tax=Aquabacterium sp. TaxID=1872578 RepID=UPI001D422021|nr:glycosyltransferase 61 family protein [Aquabacterium sp.]MBT9611017.1 glycosyltransferase family 61 protein [Aquabacterium sp.]